MNLFCWMSLLQQTTPQHEPSQQFDHGFRLKTWSPNYSQGPAAEEASSSSSLSSKEDDNVKSDGSGLSSRGGARQTQRRRQSRPEKNTKDDEPTQQQQRCFTHADLGRRLGPTFAAGHLPGPRKAVKFCAPAFLIIGFGRCGTTSLSKYLSHHPRLSFGTRKEHFYFFRPEFCDLQHGPNDKAQCDVAAYASQFPVPASNPGKNYTFDATPMLGGDMGATASDRTMRWLRDNLPHLKLLVLVKSPADRFLSNPLATAKISRLQDSLLWTTTTTTTTTTEEEEDKSDKSDKSSASSTHSAAAKGGEEVATRNGKGRDQREKRASQVVVEAVMPAKLRQVLMDNCYVDALQRWLRFFPSERFFLVRSEDLRGNLETRQSVLNSVHDFLGVEPHAYSTSHLEFLGNEHRATNQTLDPAARAVINCLPRLRSCEERLERAIQAPDRVLRWCDDAMRQWGVGGPGGPHEEHPFRIKASRPPAPRPTSLPLLDAPAVFSAGSRTQHHSSGFGGGGTSVAREPARVALRFRGADDRAAAPMKTPDDDDDKSLKRKNPKKSGGHTYVSPVSQRESSSEKASSPRCAPAGRSLDDAPDERKQRRHCAPAFLLLGFGFGAAGTADVARALDAHPQLSLGAIAESPERRSYASRAPEPCDDLATEPDFRCSLRAYAARFPVDDAVGKDEDETVFTFDATPMLGGDASPPAPPATIDWFRRQLPNLKFLVLVASPADRILANPALSDEKRRRLSDFALAFRARGSSKRSVPAPLERRLSAHCYHNLLAPWLDKFPPSRFLLVSREGLVGADETATRRVLDLVADFLGVRAVDPGVLGLPIVPDHHKFSPPLSTSSASSSSSSSSSSTVARPLDPAVRAAINCLPPLPACERRLETALDSPTTPIFDWCPGAAATEADAGAASNNDNDADEPPASRPARYRRRRRGASRDKFYPPA